jgi:hypothetical protein
MAISFVVLVVLLSFRNEPNKMTDLIIFMSGNLCILSIAPMHSRGRKWLAMIWYTRSGRPHPAALPGAADVDHYHRCWRCPHRAMCGDYCCFRHCRGCSYPPCHRFCCCGCCFPLKPKLPPPPLSLVQPQPTLPPQTRMADTVDSWPTHPWQGCTSSLSPSRRPRRCRCCLRFHLCCCFCNHCPPLCR